MPQLLLPRYGGNSVVFALHRSWVSPMDGAPVTPSGDSLDITAFALLTPPPFLSLLHSLSSVSFTFQIISFQCLSASGRHYWHSTLCQIMCWVFHIHDLIYYHLMSKILNPPAMQETPGIKLGSPGKIPWRRTWQPIPVFLPGESPLKKEPGKLQSMGSQRVGHDWATQDNEQNSLLPRETGIREARLWEIRAFI